MAHCFPAAGKWRRESKNPQRKRGKPVDFSSNPGTRLAWKSVEAILKGAVYPRERPRNLARERVEEEFSFRKVFYFSADGFFSYFTSYPNEEWTFGRTSRFLMRFINCTHNVNHPKTNTFEATNSGIAFEQRTGKTDFVIALQVSFAYPVYAVVLCAVDDTAVANNERTYRESETKRGEYRTKFWTWSSVFNEDNFL